MYIYIYIYIYKTMIVHNASFKNVFHSKKVTMPNSSLMHSKLHFIVLSVYNSGYSDFS